MWKIVFLCDFNYIVEINLFNRENKWCRNQFKKGHNERISSINFTGDFKHQCAEKYLISSISIFSPFNPHCCTFPEDYWGFLELQIILSSEFNC